MHQAKSVVTCFNQSSRVSRHLLPPIVLHLTLLVQGKVSFLQLQSLLGLVLQHQYTIISYHAFGIGGRESKHGVNCPSINVQPMYVTGFRFGIMESTWSHIVV